MRKYLKEYYGSGDRSAAKRALGSFSRGSAGGGSGTPQRVARAARIAGAAFSALANAADGQAGAASGLDLSSYIGQPVTNVIGAIVDAFCPPGIIDEDTIRASVAEALVEALSGIDTFDPTAIDDHTILIATRCFVAELVFSAVTAEQGQAAVDVPPAQAIARENDLRDIIREIADVTATPILQRVQGQVGQVQIEQLVKQVATAVYKEMATWH